MKKDLGQSSIELLLAIGIFTVLAGTLSFLVLDSYSTGRLANEITVADYLAEEGIEAARSIRDANWDDLAAGNHGLAIAAGKWIFQGTQEDITNWLSGGIRSLSIENIDISRKKITCQVSWSFTGNRPQQIQLVTYLTNWQELSEPQLEILRPTDFTDSGGRTTDPQLAFDEQDGATWTTTSYDVSANPSVTFHTWQTTIHTYYTLTLKYRYHADLGTDDTYAAAYSTDGGTGWTDLILPTSQGSPDTTLSVDLSPLQDLSQLQVKIYTQKAKGPDGQNIYTRDIWTEGNF